jgi:hypothetical protein
MNTTNYWIIAAQITVPFVASFAATWVNFWLTNKRLTSEVPMALQRQKYEAILSANKRVWSLVSFMTETENAHSVVTWSEKQGVKTYWFHPEKADAFMVQRRLIFYDEGHGVFLSRKVTDAIAIYRSKVYGLMLTGDKSLEKMELKNPELAKELFKLAETMRVEIRKAIELNERVLPHDEK